VTGSPLCGLRDDHVRTDPTRKVFDIHEALRCPERDIDSLSQRSQNLPTVYPKQRVRSCESGSLVTVDERMQF